MQDDSKKPKNTSLSSKHGKQSPVPPQGNSAKMPVMPPSAGMSSANENETAISALKAIEKSRAKKGRRKKVIITIVAVALVAIMAAIAASKIISANSMEEITYDVGVVDRGNYESTVTTSGSIAPVSSVRITPEINGIISEVCVSKGDEVTEGQTLCVLKNDQLDSAVSQANQQVAIANNGVNSAKLQLDAAKKALNAPKPAVPEEIGPDGKPIKMPAIDNSAELQAAVDQAQVALDSAYLSVNSAQLAYDEACAQAAKRTITAPSAGVVLSLNAKEGAGIGMGNTAQAADPTLMTIADLSQMRVTVQVNEVDINKIKQGETATVTFAALPGVELAATVDSIAALSDSSASQASGYPNGGGVVTYSVELLIPNPDPSIKVGMTASVEIQTENLEDVLLVPARAIDDLGDGTGEIRVVTGYDEDTPIYETRVVTIDAKNVDTVVVSGNILENDEIIVAQHGGSADDGE